MIDFSAIGCILRALMDVIVVLSSCPMDVTPINGPDKTPKPVQCEVLAAR